MKPTLKLDLYKEHKQQYVAPRKPVFVDIPAVAYLAIDGRGEPAGEEFQSKVGTLYAAAYTLKMAKKSAGQDYKVCGLEALWWTEAASKRFTDVPPREWNWRLLIRVPDFITAKEVKQAAETLRSRGKGAGAAEVRLERFKEGRCVQMLHVGPYSEEERSIEAMMRFAEEHEMRFEGKHHEIYVSDPRRVAPERLRTILRHPVRAA